MAGKFPLPSIHPEKITQVPAMQMVIKTFPWINMYAKYAKETAQRNKGVAAQTKVVIIIRKNNRREQNYSAQRRVARENIFLCVIPFAALGSLTLVVPLPCSQTLLFLLSHPETRRETRSSERVKLGTFLLERWK